MVLNGIKIEYSSTYIYLGAVINDHASYTSIFNQQRQKLKHIIQYRSSIQRNPDFLFTVK